MSIATALWDQLAVKSQGDLSYWRRDNVQTPLLIEVYESKSLIEEVFLNLKINACQKNSPKLDKIE